ncbi:MAG: AAA family ATPase [Roseomonas sp.]|nr:AAA family ATPase [Roseomonas sp.]
MNAPTSPRVAIISLTFSDDTKVSFSKDDVVLVVGPNNAGKSAALRAIRDKLQGDAFSPVLKALEIQRIGSPETLSSWLVGWTVRQSGSPVGDPVFQALGQSVQQSIASHYWQREDHVLGALSRWFCHFLSADERLQICNPPGNIALLHADPIHPIHFLQRDDELELRLSAKFRKAFGIDLIVHRNAGNQVPLHVGARPIPGPGKDRVSREFVEELEKLPTLHYQGDGMRSFAGVLLSTSVGKESIMLIDEPEAFLHPPQARLLGTTLVQDRHKDRQLFIATHSTDILRGVLDAESPVVKVLRVQRSGDKNIVRMLDNHRIKELWGDPLLRYSNILDGLFHERVVVCEADSDCRFFAAVLDAVIASKSDDSKRPDLMFTHCGGKSRLPIVIRALREVDVPVNAVADFDVLSEEQPLRSIIEALGIDWVSLQKDWQIVKSAVDSKKPDLNTEEVKSEILKVFTDTDTPVLPPKAKMQIQAILRRSSAWAHAKSVGKSFVPPGDPSRACERLLGNLRAGGLFVVEVGELEGYVRTENGHGPKWVNAVLTRDLASDPEIETARRFVQDLAGI